MEDDGLILRLEQLEMSDAANYSCHASNSYGEDSITYQLVVKCNNPPSFNDALKLRFKRPFHVSVSRNNGVPPAPPASLVATLRSHSAIALAWAPSRVDGGSPITGYRLHFHKQFGDWDRVELRVNASSYILRNLRCGTVYQFFMEAINDFGVGRQNLSFEK